MQSPEAKEIQAYIQGYGIKQVWVAKQAGVSRSMITRFLNGERGMKSDRIEKVRVALGLSGNQRVA